MPAAWPGEVLEARLQGAARCDRMPVQAPGRLQQRVGGPELAGGKPVLWPAAPAILSSASRLRGATHY